MLLSAESSLGAAGVMLSCVAWLFKYMAAMKARGGTASADVSAGLA